MLSKMMLSGANVLILDDPTNHLDLESIESLNEGLVKFNGVVLFSSHDHEFISTIANRIIEITPNGIIDRMIHCLDMMDEHYVTELLEVDKPEDCIVSQKSVDEIMTRYKNEFFQMFSEWFYNLWD
jgi:ABC-type multidrug transport system ATPase subunit